VRELQSRADIPRARKRAAPFDKGDQLSFAALSSYCWVLEAKMAAEVVFYESGEAVLGEAIVFGDEGFGFG
jgi:hypothetical protein